MGPPSLATFMTHRVTENILPTDLGKKVAVYAKLDVTTMALEVAWTTLNKTEKTINSSPGGKNSSKPQRAQQTPPPHQTTP